MYHDRPGPPFPGNEPGCRGLYKRGNDGLLYKSVPTRGGYHRFQKVRGSSISPSVDSDDVSVPAGLVFDPARPCGTSYRDGRHPTRYTREDVETMSEAYGLPYRGQTMDKLCGNLRSKVGATQRVAAPYVPAPVVSTGKRCGSSYRGGNRYTRSELERLASRAGITYHHRTMDAICKDLSL